MNTDLNRLSRRMIGAADAVSNWLGAGFLEVVDERAQAIELESSCIRFDRQSQFIVNYREREVGRYIADFVVENSLLQEIKALNRLLPEHQARLLNYLKASRLHLGLLMNFGRPRIEIKRMAL